MNKKEFKTKVFGIIVDYVHDDLFKTDNCVKSIDEFWNWINQNYISKEEMSKIIEQNRDDMTRLYDYDGIAKDVIELVNK